MAREYAQIRLTIWADRDFTALTPEQQSLYLMLISQPTINLAGVIDYLPGRLARLSGGLTAAKVGRIVAELEDRDFVFLDEETDELLVRSVIRTSGAWKAPTVAKSIAANVQQTLSLKLKSILLTELMRVCGEATEAGQWEKAATHLQGVTDTLTRAGIDPWAKGAPKGMSKGIDDGIAKGAGGEGEGEGTGGEGKGHGAIEPIARPDSSGAFDQWWTHWPKKTAKGDAKKAFPKALRAAGLTALIDGADTYAAWVDRNRIEDRFVVGPGKWLRDERWTDELADRAPASGSGRPTATDRMRDAWGLAQELEAEDQHRLEIGS